MAPPADIPRFQQREFGSKILTRVEIFCRSFVMEVFNGNLRGRQA